MTIELENLLGEHELSGAFFDSISEPQYTGSTSMQECTVLRFTLDGRHMEAVEDPEDGYRSTLSEVRETDTAPENTFPPVKVIGQWRPQGTDEWSCKDVVLQLINPANGKPIIEIGTSDVDDYYPGFVGYFLPENMMTPAEPSI